MAVTLRISSKPNPQFPADLITFTEDIHNGKLHFLCSVACLKQERSIWAVPIYLYSQQPSKHIT